MIEKKHFKTVIQHHKNKIVQEIYYEEGSKQVPATLNKKGEVILEAYETPIIKKHVINHPKNN